MKQNKKNNINNLKNDDTSIEEEIQDEVNEDENLENIDSKFEEMSEEIENLRDELKNLHDKDLRLKAEFDNFRKRTVKEKENLYASAQADCIVPLLTVLDSLERALDSVKDDENLEKGIKLVVDQFYNVLKKMGVSEIESEGKPFDPNCHNAINIIENKNFDHNTICQVLQKGYKLKDIVIRHAMVVVANP